MTTPSPSDCDPDDDPLCPVCGNSLNVGKGTASCIDTACGWDYCEEPDEPCDFIHA